MPTYQITFSGKFKKDYKKFLKQNKQLQQIQATISKLGDNGVNGLSNVMKPHKLLGNYAGLWECHILPDLLLIWEQEDAPTNKIHLIRVGSHSELF